MRLLRAILARLRKLFRHHRRVGPPKKFPSRPRLNRPEEKLPQTLQIPTDISIYHITHLDNLAGIKRRNLLSDRVCSDRRVRPQEIGLADIKERRLNQKFVPVQPPAPVGDFVPFNFCPRSVMLCRVSYDSDQSEVVHLRASLQRVLEWAAIRSWLWAFTDDNASRNQVNFYFDLDDLNMIDWTAVLTRNWGGDPKYKGPKQAEFLFYHSFPWELVEEIGVHNEKVAEQVKAEIARSGHRPSVSLRPDWYF